MTTAAYIAKSRKSLDEVVVVLADQRKLITEVSSLVDRVRVVAERNAREVRQMTGGVIAISQPSVQTLASLNDLEEQWRDVARLVERLATSLAEAQTHADALSTAAEPAAGSASDSSSA